MKKSIELMTLALLTPIFYWLAVGIFGQVIFEPFLAAVVFTIAFIVLAVMTTDEYHIPALFSIVVGISLFLIAKHMNADQIEFEAAQTWDACDSSPYLPSVTWGWVTQLIISAVLAVCCWFGGNIKRLVENKKGEQ